MSLDMIQNLMITENIKSVEMDSKGRVVSISYFDKIKDELPQKTEMTKNPFEDVKEYEDPKDDPELWLDGERPVFSKIRNASR